MLYGYTKTTWVVAALMAVITSQSISSTAVANVLANPGFESPNASGGDVYGSTSWNAFNDAYTTTHVTPNSGTQALKVSGMPST